jgi:hypothetical protein
MIVIEATDLANYVSHRRVILDLLEKLITQDSEGSYAKEELIHELIMPMGKTSSLFISFVTYDEVTTSTLARWLKFVLELSGINSSIKIR